MLSTDTGEAKKAFLLPQKNEILSKTRSSTQTTEYEESLLNKLMNKKRPGGS